MNTTTRKDVHDKYWDAGFGYSFRRACKLWDTYYCQRRETKKCMVLARYYRELGTFEASGTHQDDLEAAAMEAQMLMRRIYEMASELRTVDPRMNVETCFGNAMAEIDRTLPPLPSDKEIRLAQLLNQYEVLSAVEYFDRIGEIFNEIDLVICHS